MDDVQGLARRHAISVCTPGPIKGEAGVAACSAAAAGLPMAVGVGVEECSFSVLSFPLCMSSALFASLRVPSLYFVSSPPTLSVI